MRGITRAATVFAVLPWLVLGTPSKHATFNGTRSIEWNPCKIAGSLPGECGHLKVPLDYTNPNSSAKLDLSIIKVPAPGKKQGSLFVNFGGPGASGIDDLADTAERIQAVTAGQYDILNVVPRGTNDTLPFSCYPNTVSRLVGGDNIVGTASDTAPGEIWAYSKIFSDNCAALQNKTGNFLGTAFVARDMMQVVDALDEDGMIRYLGYSYGTLLGSTLVAMFPDKVDKVVLDGVVNPFEYYANREVELMASADDVFHGFCKGCVDEPKNCPLAKNMTVDELQNSLYKALDDLKHNPIPIPNPEFPGGGNLVDYSIVKAFIHRQLYFVSGWPALATMLESVISRDVEGLAESGLAGAATADLLDAESQLGIKCGDVLPSGRADGIKELAPTYLARHRLSRISGDIADQVLFRCAQWKLPAKERYSGNFDVQPKNPVLVVNNRYDPVTPLVSARNVTETIHGSVLLEQNAYGHTTSGQISLCTAKAIRSYFVHGDLPKPGTVCDVDLPLFDASTGWGDVIEALKDDPVD